MEQQTGRENIYINAWFGLERGRKNTHGEQVGKNKKRKELLKAAQNRGPGGTKEVGAPKSNGEVESSWKFTRMEKGEEVMYDNGGQFARGGVAGGGTERKTRQGNGSNLYG